MEEKVYTRAVSKSSLAQSLLDKKQFSRIFTRKEMDDFCKNYDWVQCDKCEKWRILPPECDIDVETLPDKVSEISFRLICFCNFALN